MAYPKIQNKVESQGRLREGSGSKNAKLIQRIKAQETILKPTKIGARITAPSPVAIEKNGNACEDSRPNP